MADYGIKVSKEGFDALTADPKNLIFDSTKNQLKVAVVLSESFASNGANQTITIPHTLPYIPGFLPFVKIGARWYGNVGNDPINDFQWMFSADTTNIYFNLEDPGASVQTIELKIYVLVDGASSTTSDTSATNPFGVAVSQEGFDVTDAIDQQLSLSTGFPEALQIVDLVEMSHTANGDVSSAHNLGFTPAWIGVVIDNAGTFFATGTAFLVPYLLVGALELMVWTDSLDVSSRVEAISAPNVTFYIALLSADLEE